MFTRGLALLCVAASLVCAQTNKSKSPAKAKAPAATKPADNSGPVLLPPKDESSRDKMLAAFLLRLKDVARRKDRAGLEALLANDVDSGGDTNGPSAFILGWGMQEPGSSVYALITQVLSMPGVWQDARYCAPYVSVQFPAGLERSKYQVVLNPDLKVHASKSTSSPVVATLAYNIVEILERAEWAKIRTASGIEGYVPIAYLYSPAAVSMCAAKDDAGAWKLQWLAPGKPK